MTRRLTLARRTVCAGFAAVLALAPLPGYAAPRPGTFTLAVIPDTQGYLDFTHQTAAGFPFDAKAQFLEQMRFVAGRAGAGGDIAFATMMGDVWQHPTIPMDPVHAARGFKRIPNLIIDPDIAPEQVAKVEVPIAREGFGLLDGKLPFSVVPGNHDYDAQWSDPSRIPDPVYDPKNPVTLGMIHVGGLASWTGVFGDSQPLFKGRPWYLGGFNGGADSAQVFTAGGYRFLHIGLEYGASDADLAWAEGVIRRHPGLPVIVSTHDFLDAHGARLPHPSFDMHAVDPLDNDPQDVWDKFIRRHDAIFLVLSGHESGQARRVDPNAAGHKVWQVMADYQNRGQTAKDAGRPAAIGDGWLRLMAFDFTGAVPTVRVRTYSTRYQAFSSDLPTYAAWYRPGEQPKMTDAEFLAAEDFTLTLDDFRARFGKPKR
jgi:hypothetical protein